MTIEKNQILKKFSLMLRVFNLNNDFYLKKVNLLIFMVATAIIEDRKFFLDFFTDFDNDFYFTSDDDLMVVNPGFLKIFKENKSSLFFDLDFKKPMSVKLFSSKDELREKVLDSFFHEDRSKGENILNNLEKSLNFLEGYMIVHFVNKLVFELEKYLEYSISLIFLEILESLHTKDLRDFKKDINHFYELLDKEFLAYGNHFYGTV